ncbi:NUDIX domain-containing protein [Candidatus Woesearchaeota archaeon]|nr:NUDIX domain-containing protein [Candidatus Woesearchaeota archaeon]
MIVNLAGCVIIKNGSLLLLWKIKRNHYEFPGGKVEEGESFEETAIREAKEELGVNVSLVKYLGFKEFNFNNKVYRSHMFLSNIAEGEVPMVAEPDVFKELFWLPIKNYEDYGVAFNVKAFCEDFIKEKY